MASARLMRQIQIALWQAGMSAFGQLWCRKLGVKQCWLQKRQTQEAALHEADDQRSLCFSFQDCNKRSGCQSFVAEKAELCDSSSSLHPLNHKGCIQGTIWVLEPNRTFKSFLSQAEIRFYPGLANTSDCHKSLPDPGYCSLSLKELSRCIWSWLSHKAQYQLSEGREAHRATASPDPLLAV